MVISNKIDNSLTNRKILSVYIVFTLVMFIFLEDGLRFLAKRWDYEPLGYAAMVIGYGFMAFLMIFKVNLRNFDKRLFLLIICLSAISVLTGGSSISIFRIGLVAIFTFFIMRYKQSQLESVFNFIFFINSVLILLQFIGVDEIFYWYQYYAAEIDNNAYVFMQTSFPTSQQFRPSGMFSSTIFLNVFLTTYFSYLLFSKRKIHVRFYICFGMVAPFIGSTHSFFLVILSFLLFYLFNRKMVYLLFGAIFSYIILYIWFPVFFYINYNFENTLASLGTRFTTDNFKDASLITGSPEVIIAVGIIVMLFILYQGVNSKIYLVYIEIVYLGLILVPVVLHQVQSNSMYVFHCAVLLSYYIGERKKEFLNNSSHLSTKK